MVINETQALIRDTARAFAEEHLKPNAAKWDAESIFPSEALSELGKLGFMGMLVPEEMGGAGSDHVAYALALEEIAAGDGSTSTIMSVHNSVGCMPVLKFGTDMQKERFLKPMARGEQLGCFCLTEPGAGSDAFAMTTKAEKCDGGYLINGNKSFISNAPVADVIIVFAVTNAATAYEQFITVCNREISKIILGQTLSAETVTHAGTLGGSFGRTRAGLEAIWATPMAAVDLEYYRYNNRFTGTIHGTDRAYGNTTDLMFTGFKQWDWNDKYAVQMIYAVESAYEEGVGFSRGFRWGFGGAARWRPDAETDVALGVMLFCVPLRRS